MTKSRFKLVWKGKQSEKAIKNALKKGLNDAALSTEAYIKKKLSEKDNRSGGNPSRPGEYPAAVTTQLRESIFSDVREGYQGLLAIVASAKGPASDYSAYLEFSMDRSFLRRGVDENQREIQRLLSRRLF